MPARAALAACLVAVAVAAFLWGWWWAGDRPACRQQNDPWACTDTGIGMVIVGIPAVLIVVWSILKTCRARWPSVGVICLTLVCVALVFATEPLEPHVATWPVVAGLATSAYLAVEARIVRRPDAHNDRSQKERGIK